MKKVDLEALTIDELWALHEETSRILSIRIGAEKRELEKRLALLNRGKDFIEEGELRPRSLDKPRRKYPRVFPKYQNPLIPSETWSGRGKQPRWLAAAIKSGRKIDDFKIGGATGSKSQSRRKRA
jgi:DNA-binding protein H-NS